MSRADPFWQANNPEKLLRQLALRSERVRALVRHLEEVETALSAEAITALLQAREKSLRKREEAERLRTATFPKTMLEGTGSELWTSLWESARQFSQNLVYPGQEYPVIDDGAQCVLCQQSLDNEAGQRLKKFEAFVTSSTERELRESIETFSRLSKAYFELKTANDAIEEIIKEIRIEHEELADTISAALEMNESRRIAVVEAFASDKDLGEDCPVLIKVAQEAVAFIGQLEGRIKTLRGSSADETIKHMTAEAQEFRARKLLATNIETALNEIERKKKIAAYGLCISDTKTHAITQKSTAVTRTSVTQKLKQSFQKELSDLAFRHVEVELKEVGGAEGILYHKLILTRAPGVEVPRVVSEGEQRCLSIAAFFAELITADDQSGIVFDDPVSSLDYKWREGVARRLVEEARTRQVIVFTHDIVFLLLLKQLSEELGIEQLDQYVRQLSLGAGICAEELPWVALKVSKRIGHLKKCQQDAEKLHREGHQDAYEREASLIYGFLREAWERGLEEVLLNGVVERYRTGVQTQQVSRIADITPDDCKAVEIAMTKCSKWLPGHDQSAASRADIPEPAQLKSDIEALENWVKAIRKRRE